MIRDAFLAGLLVWSAVVPARAAGDPASVVAVESFFRDDEKAMLAAVLANEAASADFNADMRLVAGDAAVIKLVLDKWRGRIVELAESELRIVTPDLDGTYKNYGALLAPSTHAYLLRRLDTMKEPDRGSLIEHLGAVDSALSSNGGKLTWYARTVVTGIFDRYRQDLSTYLSEPIAQNGRTSAIAAAAALTERRKSAEQAVAVRNQALSKPVPPAAALERARRMTVTAARAAANFDAAKFFN